MTGYSSFIAQLGAIAPYVVSDATAAAPFLDTNVNAILPQLIAYAEGRIYREPEFDFLALHTTATASTAANSRLVAIPSNILISDGINLITPAGSTTATTGAERVTLKRVTLDYLDFVWNVSVGASGQGQPVYYAIYDSANLRLAPTPSAIYQLEFTGTFTPTALSSTNTDTFLTTYLNDLFFAASMTFVAGYQRNFGAQSDDPQMALSWERAYTGLKTGAAVNEARKQARGPNYGVDPPMPLVAPPALPQTST